MFAGFELAGCHITALATHPSHALGCLFWALQMHQWQDKADFAGIAEGDLESVFIGTSQIDSETGPASGPRHHELDDGSSLRGTHMASGASSFAEGVNLWSGNLGRFSSIGTRPTQ